MEDSATSKDEDLYEIEVDEVEIESEFGDSENDVVLEDSDAVAVFRQDDTTVMWRIDGLYKDDSDSLHSKSYLKKNPPVFIVENTEGDIAEFLLTQNLSYSLREAFDRVYQGYYGVEKKRRELDPITGKPKKASAKDYVKDNPLKVGLVSVVVILAIAFLLLF